MSKFFTAKLNNDEIIKKLNNLTKNFKNLTPFLKLIRVKLMAEIDNNFETEGKSSGEKWKEWSEKYRKLRIKHGGGRILNRSGKLRTSFTSRLTANSLTIGTAKEYAAIHNFGHERKNMPKREFMRFSEKTYEEILTDINNYAQNLIKKTIKN